MASDGCAGAGLGDAACAVAGGGCGDIAELGYARASVAHITARARVSRRTFYDLFANREECLVAVLEDVVRGVRGDRACGPDGFGVA